MSQVNRPEMERKSSFARSFFQSGEGDPIETQVPLTGGDEEAAASLRSVGRSNSDMRRQRSRRRVSRTSFRSSGDPSLLRAAQAAAAAVQYEEGEPIENLPGIGSMDSKYDDPNTVASTESQSLGRRSSWMSDALAQGGGNTELSKILLSEENGAATPSTSSVNDELLEQYRMMAHIEASIRVKDNIGFDMEEYEKRRKLEPEQNKKDYYGGANRCKPKLPEPTVPTSIGKSPWSVKPKAPVLPSGRKYDLPPRPQIPEIVLGIVMRGQGHAPDGEHMTQCLGCKAQVRVHLFAPLMKCPDCLTVSPATSSRRKENPLE